MGYAHIYNFSLGVQQKKRLGTAGLQTPFVLFDDSDELDNQSIMYLTCQNMI